MNATRFDSVFRYHVDSDSRHETKHLVELDAYQCNSACTCEYFTYRLEPMLKAGAQPSNDTRCKHIIAARDTFLKEMIEVIKERALRNEKETA